MQELLDIIKDIKIVLWENNYINPSLKKLLFKLENKISKKPLIEQEVDEDIYLLFKMWFKECGETTVTTGYIAKMIDQYYHQYSEIIMPKINRKAGKIDHAMLGRKLSKMQDLFYGDFKIVRSGGTTHSKFKLVKRSSK